MISVIVPAYNCAKTIEKCIVSILNQSYSDLELIVINDGSTDETKEKILRYVDMDKRIRLVDETNSGVSVARNKGIRSAKGKYICFIDSDDYISPEYLQVLYEAFLPNSLPVVNFSYNADCKGILPLSDEIVDVKMLNLGEEYLIGSIGKKIAFSVCNKLFVKQILVENEIFFRREISMGEDLIFNLEYLMYCERIILCNKSLYHYTIREGSAVNSKKTDFSLKYEATFNELKKLNHLQTNCFEGVMEKWCLDVMPYILLSNYVSSKTYQEFISYFYDLKNLGLVQAAENNRKKCGIKKKVIQITLKKNIPLLLFLAIKANVFKQKWVNR